MNQNHISALNLFSSYTAGHFDPWMLAGPAKASCRAHIMSVFNGQRTPQSKSGVTVIRDAFHTLAFNECIPDFKAAECVAVRDEVFTRWARSFVTSKPQA